MPSRYACWPIGLVLKPRNLEGQPDHHGLLTTQRAAKCAPTTTTTCGAWAGEGQELPSICRRPPQEPGLPVRRSRLAVATRVLDIGSRRRGRLGCQGAPARCEKEHGLANVPIHLRAETTSPLPQHRRMCRAATSRARTWEVVGAPHGAWRRQAVGSGVAQHDLPHPEACWQPR